MSEQWLSLTEAANWVRSEYERAGRSISRKTVSRWARYGKVRAQQRERMWYVDASSLQSFVAGELMAEPNGQPCGDATHDTAPAEDPDAARIRKLREFIARRNARFLKDLEAGID